jgi:uncharacterized membrane protein
MTTSETEGGHVPGPRRRNWLRVLLIASLTLNLLLIGAAAGRMWRWHHHGRDFDGAGILLSHVPADKRAGIEAMIERDRAAMRGQLDAMEAARKEVSAALIAEPFDKARFIAALQSMHQSGLAARSVTAATLAEIASHLSIEERKAFARRLERRGGRGMRRWMEGGP